MSIRSDFILTNFAPYKSKIKRKKIIKLIGVLMVGVFFSSVAVYGMSNFYEDKTRKQENRNTTIKTLSSALDKDIRAINKIKSDISRVESIQRVISDVQYERYVLIKIMNSLSRVVPDGVELDSVIIQNGMVNLLGVSSSNNRVSVLMANLKKYGGVLHNPVLVKIENEKNKGMAIFQVITQINKNYEEEDEKELTLGVDLEESIYILGDENEF